jgi:alkanesulfonate monooxygenase SsuD/methylene tetrahydromethanopterin reductase-like flavin-dependent oxidoreductase (luciferase family)
VKFWGSLRITVSARLLDAPADAISSQGGIAQQTSTASRDGHGVSGGIDIYAAAVDPGRSTPRSGRTLRELILEARHTGHWSADGTPEQLADAIEERYRAGVLDIIALGGLDDPRTRDFVTDGLLPELRRRDIVGSDYLGATFRENLELPPLPEVDTERVAV